MSSKKATRKEYDEEYKKKIADRVLSGESVTAIAEAEGLNPSQLYNWRKKYSPSGVKEIKPSHALKDAVFYLQKAVDAINADIRSGTLKKEKEYHLLTKLALSRLVG